MSKLFYDHLIILDDCLVEIDSLEIDISEKDELKKIIDSTVHHGVITHILDLLPNEHHEEFLERLHSAPHDLRNLAYIDNKIEADIQAEIVTLGKKLKREILTEVKKAQKQKEGKRKT